ncbi:zinc-ribbon domain-containing protein, partial [Neobacillus drentensis]|uniref:zinc-ribbon domain-containing protein n=1 Tax=Neobacillus drentensis TaxID=220684 RepID=UPI002FFDB573
VHRDKQKEDEEKNKILTDIKLKFLRIREKGLPDIESYGTTVFSRTSRADRDLNKIIKKVLDWLSEDKPSIEVDVHKDRFNILEQITQIKIENSLSEKFPNLAKEWNIEKNAPLMPEHVQSQSNLQVWWKCKKGHEWEATVAHRTNLKRPTNCPYCKGKKPSVDYNLAVVNPALARQWHPSKNDKLRPNDVVPNSSLKVWWLGGCGHEWEATVAHRTNSTNCPYCRGLRTDSSNSLQALNPQIASQWHASKNGDLTPSDVPIHSHKKIWWICESYHEWEALVSNRTKGSGCPYCSRKKSSESTNLFVENPELASQWHPIKNKELTPYDVLSGSNKKVWWICEKNHEWRASIASRAGGGYGCPFCSGRYATSEYNLAIVNPNLAEEWHLDKNLALTPYDVTPGSGKKVWWKCRLNGHEWQAIIGNRHKHGTGCPICRKKR